MPRYDFECKGCGHTWEEVRKSDAEPPPCPNPEEKKKPCEGPVEKLISLSSFQLKGGGWAEDGYG